MNKQMKKIRTGIYKASAVRLIDDALYRALRGTAAYRSMSMGETPHMLPFRWRKSNGMKLAVRQCFSFEEDGEAVLCCEEKDSTKKITKELIADVVKRWADNKEKAAAVVRRLEGAADEETIAVCGSPLNPFKQAEMKMLTDELKKAASSQANVRMKSSITKKIENLLS